MLLVLLEDKGRISLHLLFCSLAQSNTVHATTAAHSQIMVQGYAVIFHTAPHTCDDERDSLAKCK